MARTPRLTFDRGTLILHPPPRGKAWVDYATWDDRIEKFRVPGMYYRPLVEVLQAEDIYFVDDASEFAPLELVASFEMEPYLHQQEALLAWKQAGRRGVVVLPTAAGKTYLAQLAMQCTPRTTLIVVPTLDLMHQWYAQLDAAFPDVEVGLLGGGSHDRTPILIATYDSATIHAESLGNLYGLLVFDECHHLPTDFYRATAEYAIAPYRLGLTATPDRSDGRHNDLNALIGLEVYRKTPAELAGLALADHQVVQIKVKLSQKERDRYNACIKLRNDFLKEANIYLGSINGWQRFVQTSASSQKGRRAMLAHRESKAISLGTEGKLRVLADLLAKHYPERILIFTNDNATVYRISQEFLTPALTHQTPVKERHEILTRFREGEYKTIAASHVLNEGVDVPDARVAIILSGTGSEREYVQRLGRVLRKGTDQNKLALLYEVVAENTSEEGTSQRRRGGGGKKERKEIEKPKSKHQQLELLPSQPYEVKPSKTPKAAESKDKWGYDTEFEDR
ncbi:MULTISPECIES: DEAD/DEAH box helicase family protein [unclassified Coleofasciculus]|uniref:DEAD/DEAH box helicase family protein n=1 Tax=unclassified Coleofasciculus TaxID=2692782 RepID=UPI0018804979|nr:MULTISPECIES: DEAD/DEAH box helicase family protein [unclassified Coleofasciculus]MBE9127292.1 DEAD/DEAH box helicase family protein [Coleofasciculus sp. LEGE 07081]MBE9151545.1 DEAD/DEAH box helicase family protein [Coleofasciculus sp. LEGE 07092]